MIAKLLKALRGWKTYAIGLATMIVAGIEMATDAQVPGSVYAGLLGAAAMALRAGIQKMKEGEP